MLKPKPLHVENTLSPTVDTVRKIVDENEAILLNEATSNSRQHAMLRVAWEMQKAAIMARAAEKDRGVREIDEAVIVGIGKGVAQAVASRMCEMAHIGVLKDTSDEGLMSAIVDFFETCAQECLELAIATRAGDVEGARFYSTNIPQGRT